MMEKYEDAWKCTICGKMSKDKSNLKRHIETQIDQKVLLIIILLKLIDTTILIKWPQNKGTLKFILENNV